MVNMARFSSHSVIFTFLIAVVFAEISTDGLLCPDGKRVCERTTICCPKENGEYGCCNVTEPVEGGTVCPDQKTSCPVESTCCATSDTTYACCPLARAVCCSDHRHCCPENTVCDVTAMMCNKRSEASVKQTTIVKRNNFKVKLAGSKACGTKADGPQCPDDATCCKLPNGEWGCCPMRDAVCCDDHIHCCPSGSICDNGYCKSQSESLNMVSLQNTAFQIQSEKQVVCPDGESQCPDGMTCCMFGSGAYGCCPMSNAVCCSEFERCCPENTKCNYDGRCVQLTSRVPWVAKLRAKPLPKLRNVVCPGGEYQCPDGNTCCKLSSGEWGCCPLPNATCCDDKVHCCPEGTTCQGSSCAALDKSIPWSTKFNATPIPTL